MSISPILADLYRSAGNTTVKSFTYRLLLDPGFKFLYYFRKSQAHSRKTPWGFFYYLMYRRYSVKYGFQFPLSVKIGAGLHLPHFGNIVLNSGSVIGRNCNILQGATLGNTKRGSKVGAPILGDNVYIGPNAVIVGNVRIGNKVLIAPNAYVNVDVPDNTIVIGNPAILKPNSKAVEGYLTNVKL